ncbi:MAG: hypothetical protein J5588_03180, partial [Bacteroidales bacterium]|nr:hypothetical protein [Bacteroidales bacterium]
MTNEQKQLLVKDLGARLPYEVKVNVTNSTIYKDPMNVMGIDYSNEIVKIGENIGGMFFTHKERVADVKPYLRPMSSMTEDEKEELSDLLYKDFDGTLITYTRMDKVLSWLNQ